ncbi:MAG: glycosyltransferase family 4 protein [Chloroflexaceae bacterium]|jgi:glycosyltransferase involved in cell wall biosynthesis|nr:glycosyltransferase family 4 protein [Chloroflexaceae bacterium]
MRILALSPWWPEPADNGSRMRIANLLAGLCQQHEVHLVALAQQPPETLARKETAGRCASIQAVAEQRRPLTPADRLVSLVRWEPASVRATWNPAFAAMVQQVAARVQPDVVVAFELSIAPYALLVPHVPRVLDDLEAAILYDQFTRQQGWRRLRFWLTWAKHRRYMQQMLAQFQGCTVVSQQEARLIQQLAVARLPLVVVPNGTSTGTTPTTSPEPDTLIYPGALTYTANFDAMAYFLADIFPHIQAARPAVRLQITGATPTHIQKQLPLRSGVEFTGFVPDIRSCIARSWAEVVPLRQGSGTRLKILEAMALGTPVISTRKGAEGLDVEADRHLLIADTPHDFAQATVRLLENPTLRAALQAAGQKLVRERYDWHHIGSEFRHFVGTIAENRSTHRVHAAA